MDFTAAEEANDLLSNGILVQTPRGLVCMSLNDALRSDLNLSVEDLQNVASQLLKTATKEKPLISVQTVQAINSSFVSSDGFGDSDGFTSESSDLKKERDVESSFLSSNVSDSDTNMGKPQSCAMDSSKSPKKRGGWPKGRKRKPELLHLPPKAPSTGYNLYLNDQRKLFKDSPLPFHEITKLIGNRWSSLSLGEKKPYLEKAEEEKRRYKEELREYRQSGAYQLYLANKRRKRAKYNVLSESDMDATDDLDDEDNEELYCRTCDQYFHNLHNKREHLQGRQHMQSIAGAISNEIDTGHKKETITSTIVTSNEDNSIGDYMNQLMEAVKKREKEFTTLKKSVEEKRTQNRTFNQQWVQLKEKEGKLKRELATLKEKEKDMEQKVFDLWQVPSWFVITDLAHISKS